MSTQHFLNLLNTTLLKYRQDAACNIKSQQQNASATFLFYVKLGVKKLHKVILNQSYFF